MVKMGVSNSRYEGQAADAVMAGFVPAIHVFILLAGGWHDDNY
jgi:hypothetical protein